MSPSSVAMDVRVGGAWRLTMRVRGGEVSWHGEYREVVEPERIVFTVSDQPSPDAGHALVIVELGEVGEGRTEMRFEQRGSLSPAQTSAARYAWSRLFDCLAERLAAGCGDAHGLDNGVDRSRMTLGLPHRDVHGRIARSVPNRVPHQGHRAPSEKAKIHLPCGIANGETRTRTGDTTISVVLPERSSSSYLQVVSPDPGVSVTRDREATEGKRVAIIRNE